MTVVPSWKPLNLVGGEVEDVARMIKPPSLVQPCADSEVQLSHQVKHLSSRQPQMLAVVVISRRELNPPVSGP